MRPLTAEEILALPSLLGSGLSRAIAAALGETSPPAPWHSHVEAVLWGYRSTAGAAAVPPGLRPSLPVGVGAFINYLDGAVGPYHEILATPRCVRVPGHRAVHGHVPFIAVDSVASIHGGRANWALPKLWADFRGQPSREQDLAAVGSDWSVSARVRPAGPWLPFRAAAGCAQPWPVADIAEPAGAAGDGGGAGSAGAHVSVFRSRFVGRARLARVELDVSGAPALVAALPAGRHLGIVVRASVEVAAPRPVQPRR